MQTHSQAIKNLRAYTSLRNYRIEGEEVCPAEDWLIAAIYKFDPVKKGDERRGVKLRMIEHAKVLGLYPIPDWWMVRNRILGVDASRHTITLQTTDDHGNIISEEKRYV